MKGYTLSEREVQRLLPSWFRTTCIVFSKQYFGWPYQPSSGLQMLLNLCSNHNIIYRCMENVAIKGKGRNDVQHKNTKDMDYNNSSRRFRPWGSRVMALSIKCDSRALRTESREDRGRDSAHERGGDACLILILWFLHKFSNICEEGWHGQPKYCHEKNNTRCSESALQ